MRGVVAASSAIGADNRGNRPCPKRGITPRSGPSHQLIRELSRAVRPGGEPRFHAVRERTIVPFRQSWPARTNRAPWPGRTRRHPSIRRTQSWGPLPVSSRFHLGLISVPSRSHLGPCHWPGPPGEASERQVDTPADVPQTGPALAKALGGVSFLNPSLSAGAGGCLTDSPGVPVGPTIRRSGMALAHRHGSAAAGVSLPPRFVDGRCFPARGGVNAPGGGWSLRRLSWLPSARHRACCPMATVGASTRHIAAVFADALLSRCR